jgi:hypothetical protein
MNNSTLSEGIRAYTFDVTGVLSLQLFRPRAFRFDQPFSRQGVRKGVHAALASGLRPDSGNPAFLNILHTSR